MQNLTFHKFTHKSYPAYKSWFQNKALAKALGDIDKEWLTHVTTQTDGTEFAIYLEDELVGVVGLQFPPSSGYHHVITNIAVNPSRNREGIGSAILSQLPEALNLTDEQHLIAYVETPNLAAQAFFTKNGWHRVSRDKGCDMLKFQNATNSKSGFRSDLRGAD